MSSLNSFFNFNNIKFLKGVNSPINLPDTTLPEIAFVGRSNVGKSSLLNALLNCKKVAKVSNTPGRTREINFFNLGNKIMLSDLPGYGYATMSRKTKATLDYAIQSYLKNRIQLKRVFLLIDARHGYKDSDLIIMRMLDVSAVSYQIVLTKIDKIANIEDVVKYVQDINNNFAAVYPNILKVSSKNLTGIQELQQEIMDIIQGLE